MRWFWIDRFEEFASGKHAVALKCVSLSEEPVDEYSPGRPYYPASLIVEGLAQTGGLLIAQTSDFTSRVVLAKVSKSKFHFQAVPGDLLRLRMEIEMLQPDGGITQGTVHVGDRLLCEATISFAFLDDRFEGVELFDPATFCRTLRCLRIFDIGVDQDGNPIQVPEYMLQAELANIQASQSNDAVTSS